MKKRLFSLSLALLIITSTTSSIAANFYHTDGVLRISNLNPSNTQKIMVEKGGMKYNYNISNETEWLPLQLGEGTYIVRILKHKEGNKYIVAERKNVVVNQLSENLFLKSSQPVYFDKNDEVVKLAKELTRGAKDDKEKVELIYNYIVENIEYDFQKINTINNSYVPNSDDTLREKKGICYDYAALLASMLRSQGISTKLIKGYKIGNPTYHAWNEVKIDDEWIVIDTTYDALFLGAGKDVLMFKNNDEYNPLGEY